MVEIGTQFGHYSIDAVLGSGGMGTVYRATDRHLDRTVALKVVKSELASAAEFTTRLADEARKAAAIASPYVVKVWEYGQVEGQPYIAFEYVDGRSLRDVMPELSFDEKLNLALQIARGLQAAHDARVMHRDLKPENLRVAADGDVRILDFGLAAAVSPESIATTGGVEGTIAYAAPEQLSGEATTALSDLFSYGVVLYELFTGVRPFRSEYSARLVYSILYEEPLSPREVSTAIPEWLSDLIVTLLQKAPTQRPSGMHDVIRTIEHCRSLIGDPSLTTAVRRRRSATVLHLRNLSDDSSWDYFCEGFTEDLIAELTRRSQLIVTAQPAAEMPRDVTMIFQRCRTDYVITGSLMKHAGRLRVSLVVYGDSGRRVISKRAFEGNTDDLFVLLGSAAEDTAETLSAICGVAPVAAADRPIADVSAYDYYLRGRAYYQTNRPDDLTRAEQLFRKALEIDPNLAAAHSGLSDVYAFQYMAYYDHTPERIEAARAEAMEALAIDSDLAEGHRSLGRYHMLLNEFAEAEEAFRRTIEFAPRNGVGYRTLAWLKLRQGDLEQSLTWATRALQLAPTDLETLLLISLIHMDRRRFTPATATLHRAIELGPDYGRAYYALGTVYLRLGVPELALEHLLQAIRFEGDPNSLIDAGFACLVLGDRDQARVHFEEAIRKEQMSFIATFYLGTMDAADGNTAGAAAHFNDALRQISERDPDHSDPHLIALRAAVMARSGQGEAARDLLKELETRGELTGDDLYCMARAYAGLGDADAAGVFRQRAVAAPDGPTEKEAGQDPLLRIEGA